MIRTFSYSKFLNLDTVTLWFNPLWKNSPTYAKCIGEIERGGTCSDEVWNHMIARIHFLRAEVPSLNYSNTFGKCWGIFLEWIEPKDRFQVQEFRIRKFPYHVLYVLHKTEQNVTIERFTVGPFRLWRQRMNVPVKPIAFLTFWYPSPS